MLGKYEFAEEIMEGRLAGKTVAFAVVQ